MRAFLVVLALAPQGARARTKLQDMFWSEADPGRAAQNMRTSIVRLRRSLDVSFPGLLMVDGSLIRLDLAAVDVDVLSYASGPLGARSLLRNFPGELPELAEGLDVSTFLGDEFERWLSVERRSWAERLQELRDTGDHDDDATVAAPAGGGARRGRANPGADQHFAVGLLPCAACHASPEIRLFADGVLEGLAAALQNAALVEVYDYRDAGASIARPAIGSGPVVLLRIKTEDGVDRLVLTLLAYRSDQAKLLWRWSVEIAKGDEFGLEVLRYINEAVDRICTSFASIDPSGAGPGPYHALNLMFRFDADSLATARNVIVDGHASSGDPVYLGLLAYLNSFRVGEHWLDFSEDVLAETRMLVAAVLESNSFNSLTLAMAGHACGYILHDHDLAIDLLERSTRLDGGLAICWDHLALNYLYVGRVKDAERASDKAIRLGAFSPIRFTYDATMCMINTVRGDYPRAVRYGERSLARRPNFGAALRYTAVSLAHLGRTDAAHRMIGHIRSLSPDFSSDWVSANRLAVVDPGVKARLLTGLLKAGA